MKHDIAVRAPLAARSGATAQAFWVLGFAALTAVGAQVEIPHYPVPFTLQTLFVLLAGGLLGSRLGAMSMGAYLFAGLLGIPVFSGAGFGLAKILGPTGGYLLAFPVAAYVAGFTAERTRSLPLIAAGMGAALVVIFTSGTLHLYATLVRDITTAFQSGFLLFSWWDLVKLAAATAIIYGFGRRP